MKKKLIYLIVIGFVWAGCSKTNEETLSNGSTGNTGGNTGNCDTVNMKYATNIQPIIQANCYSCHGNGQAESGISLDSYTKLKQQANNGNLIGVITHAAGYPPMPYNLPKLSDCDINKIKDWVERGAPN